MLVGSQCYGGILACCAGLRYRTIDAWCKYEGLNVFSEHNSNTLGFCRGLLTARYDSLAHEREPNKEITGTSQFLLRTGLPRQNKHIGMTNIKKNKKLSWLTNDSLHPTNFLDIRNVSRVLFYTLEFRINTIQILQTDYLET